MRILFINANLYGHINPTLGFVKKLCERGNSVDYFCAEPFAPGVLTSGANWVGYSSKLENLLKTFKPSDRHPYFMLLEYILCYVEAELPVILERIKQGNYDMIIADSIFGGVPFLTQLVTVPVVTSHSTFAMNHQPVPPRMVVPGFHPQLDYVYEILHRICERYCIQEPTLEEIFVSKGERNVVYTTSEFNGNNEITEPDYLFAGPSLDRTQNTQDVNIDAAEGRKIIYISLGSINTEFPDFYRNCMDAFRDSDYYVFLSIGNKLEISQLGEIPSNFCVKPFLPQLKILKHASAFITHAGFNSVSEAMYFGVPMLAFPQVNDQQMVAKRVVALQLGLAANIQEVTVETLKNQMSQLLKDKTIQNNCEEISDRIQASEAMDYVVDELEQYASIRKECAHGAE